MENISIKVLGTELKRFFKNEYRRDSTYRFCLLFSQLGDLFHYLTHARELNPEARSWGSREDEKGACAQALMQLLMSIVVIKLATLDVFNKAFVGLRCKSSPTIDDVEKSIKEITPKKFSSFGVMKLIIKINKSITLLESNQLSIEVAAKALESLSVYIAIRGFSFKEVLLMGLQNQRERDWAKTVVQKPTDNKLSGIVGVPGEVTGEAYVVSDKHPLSSFPSGKILVTQYGKAENVEAVSKAAGVITDNGGKMCHMVLILLPLEIVCLVGTGSATNKIKHGQMVTIFAENGSGYVQLLN